MYDEVSYSKSAIYDLQELFCNLTNHYTKPNSAPSWRLLIESQLTGSITRNYRAVYKEQDLQYHYPA